MNQKHIKAQVGRNLKCVLLEKAMSAQEKKHFAKLSDA